MNDPDEIYFGGQVWQHKTIYSRARVISLGDERFVLVNMESDGGGMTFHVFAAEHGIFPTLESLKAELDARWKHIGDARLLRIDEIHRAASAVG